MWLKLIIIKSFNPSRSCLNSVKSSFAFWFSSFRNCVNANCLCQRQFLKLSTHPGWTSVSCDTEKYKINQTGSDWNQKFCRNFFYWQRSKIFLICVSKNLYQLETHATIHIVLKTLINLIADSEIPLTVLL